MLAFIMFAVQANSQGLSEKEPSRNLLGAPTYPGAVFIRTVTGLDPYHETAEYITRDTIETVLAFFERKLPEKRQIFFEDKNLYMVAFLMKTWSKLPGNPKKDDLELLEKEPNLRVHTFDSTQYGTLIEYFRERPNGKVKADALENGKTMISYTYRLSEDETYGKNIIGAWKNVDRSLTGYYGSMAEFRENGTYTLTLTDENIKAIKNESGAKIETGTYVVMNNTISLQSQNPVRGDTKKSGIINVGRASLSMELIGLPRLTFIRVRK